MELRIQISDQHAQKTTNALHCRYNMHENLYTILITYFTICVFTLYENFLFSRLSSDDMSMHSRYLGYSMWIKSVAFTPCIVFFFLFFTLIAVYGRINDPEPNPGEDVVGGSVGGEDVSTAEDTMKHSMGPPGSRRRSSSSELLGQGEQKTDL